MKTTFFFFLVVILIACSGNKSGEQKQVSNSALKSTITKSELADKIRGGWAGQVIGCTFGGPTEFRFKGTMINDYQPIPWNENSCK